MPRLDGVPRPRALSLQPSRHALRALKPEALLRLLPLEHLDGVLDVEELRDVQVVVRAEALPLDAELEHAAHEVFEARLELGRVQALHDADHVETGEVVAE